MVNDEKMQMWYSNTKCTLFYILLFTAQAFQLLLHFSVVYHKHKIDSRCHHGQHKRQKGNSGVNEILKPAPAAGIVRVMSILLANEVTEEFCLQSVHGLLGQREVHKGHHLEEDVVTEDYQQLLFRCADVK